MTLETSEELKFKWQRIFVMIIFGGMVEIIMVLIILVAGILFIYTDMSNQTIVWLENLPVQVIGLLYFGGMLFFRIRLYRRGKKFIEYTQKGILKFAELKKCNFKSTKRGRLVKMQYCYMCDESIVTDWDECHSLDEDFNVLGLKTYQGQVIVNPGTLIPVLVYEGKSIVLFHQCGFYDIAHVNRRLDGWDFYP